jgi:hypothetical protein
MEGTENVQEPATKKRALENSKVEVSATAHARPPYLFVLFGEDGDLHWVYELDANGPDAERIVKTFREVRDADKQHANSELLVLELFNSGRELVFGDFHPRRNDRLFSTIDQAGTWKKHRVPMKQAELPGATAVFFLYGYN